MSFGNSGPALEIMVLEELTTRRLQYQVDLGGELMVEDDSQEVEVCIYGE
jgi:hypothetical protein